MQDKIIAILIGGAGAGGTVVSGLMIWWLKNAISDLRKVQVLVRSINSLKASIDGLAGKIDTMNTMIHQNNKEIAVLERDVKTQWQRYDELSSYVREKGL